MFKNALFFKIQRYFCEIRLQGMKEAILGFVLTLSIWEVDGQTNLGFQHFDNIPVLHLADTLAMPWAGGLNNPQFSSLDVNLDGINDIYAYEREGEVGRFFINDGEGNFTIDHTGFKHLPKLAGNFVLLRDYNGDGKKDIFASGYNNWGFDVYKNVSDTVLKFESEVKGLTYKKITSGFSYFTVGQNELPAIDDFDGDGDLDVMIQGYASFTWPKTFLYVENLSQENFQNNDSLHFKLANPCWGKIIESPQEAGWETYECDTTGFGRTARDERHGGTAMSSIDLDGDGEKDIVAGDIYSPRLQALFNTGGNYAGSVNIGTIDTAFPSYSTPAYVPTLPAAFFEDVDNDGVTDMLVAPNQLTSSATNFMDTSINRLVDWYYKNEGSNTLPDFTLVKKGFFSSEMIDVGTRSYPVFADLNGDNLQDLIIGNEGFTIYGGSEGANILVYLNVGDSANPAFALTDQNLAQISNLGLGIAHPAFADLDNDGDQDMMVGASDGKLHYFENTGTPEIYNFQLTEPEFSNIDVDQNAHPQFFDLNQDNLHDLVIGDYYGRFHYHENLGTANEPNFSKNAAIFQMGDIMNFHEYGGDGSVFFTRQLDSNGTNLYILQSTAKGPILVYGPIKDIYADFEIADSIVVNAKGTSITGVNLTGDFRTELVVGQISGGLFMLNRVKDISVGKVQLQATNPYIKIYPNPTKDVLNVDSKSFNQGYALIKIQDITGKTILEQNVSIVSHQFELDLAHLPQGVYVLSVFQNKVTYRCRILKQ